MGDNMRPLNICFGDDSARRGDSYRAVFGKAEATTEEDNREAPKNQDDGAHGTVPDPLFFPPPPKTPESQKLRRSTFSSSSPPPHETRGRSCFARRSFRREDGTFFRVGFGRAFIVVVDDDALRHRSFASFATRAVSDPSSYSRSFVSINMSGRCASGSYRSARRVSERNRRWRAVTSSS